MMISDILSPNDILLDVGASTKKILLQALAAKAAFRLKHPVDEITAALLKREDLGSTGMGNGIAIPHAKLPAIKMPWGFLARLKKPIAFDAIDGEAVDIAFLLLSPRAAFGGHLEALATVARTLRSGETCARVRAARTPAELYGAIETTFAMRGAMGVCSNGTVQPSPGLKRSVFSW